jgi:hypothetical protein
MTRTAAPSLAAHRPHRSVRMGCAPGRSGERQSDQRLLAGSDIRFRRGPDPQRGGRPPRFLIPFSWGPGGKAARPYPWRSWRKVGRLCGRLFVSAPFARLRGRMHFAHAGRKRLPPRLRSPAAVAAAGLDKAMPSGRRSDDRTRQPWQSNRRAMQIERRWPGADPPVWKFRRDSG